MTEKQFNKIFNAFILIGMAVVTVLVTGIKLRAAGSDETLWLLVSAFGSLMGVLATVCSANGWIITFHRNLRSKAAIQSALREIRGVGEKTEQRLLLHYGSVARIAGAPLEELSALVGADLAVRIHDYLNND